MRVFLIGYPGEMGGANTEAWHTVKLWVEYGVDVHLIPTWGCDEAWRARVDALGCTTHVVSPDKLDQVPNLPGSPVVSFCNSQFIAHAEQFRKLGCPLVWANCMTFMFDHERECFGKIGPADAYVFQSEFQRSELEPQLAELGYTPERGHLIRGAFDLDEFEFTPRPHAPGEVFVVGRMARPDTDKWSSNTWPIYSGIQYANKRALMLGMDQRTHEKLGAPPVFADCLKPMAISVKQFLSTLHCLLPINGGARENWPRAGLEAMAAGVPIVAQNDWGWRELIEHGVTGFLGSNDCELAHYAACLAYDEDLRQRIVHTARERLVEDLANPKRLWESWKQLFRSVGQYVSDVDGIPHAHTYAGTLEPEEVA
ncbi:glycosyltransferase [Bremerella sp. P1]|uniref:glycosyltransferase n=1 Tax=Bremerella sp. P1 TaxID=3026424 RepID=UPI0023686DDF|nr:glycosyltransferase [Bremerella sp. P1]WDI40522.1 glycosyltransferase [Bremerella sp. P1]